MQKKSTKREPRRQARGQKRITELLKAAGEVFQEVGYESATTNAIAAKAGVSPGTLYQFFPNKQAIAEALANEYAAKNKEVHEKAFQLDIAALPLHELLDRLVDPFLAFRRNAPGFEALFTGSVVSRELASRIQALHEQLKQRIAHVIQLRNSRIPPDAVQSYAETSVQIVKGLLPLALNGTAEQRASGARELKIVLERYITPLEEKTPAMKKQTR